LARGLIVKKPWDYHSDLTKERLVAIATLLRDARHDALDRYDSDKGCNGWTLGCEAFAFGCARLKAAAGGPGFEWLTIQDPTMRFMFTVGDVIARFYHGAADEPNSRTLKVSYSELRQGVLDFGGTPAGELVFRFAIETDGLGEVTVISFTGLLGNTPEFVYEIPLDPATPALAPFSLPKAEGVELPKPVVRKPGDDKKTGEG
jgi:hypothetical protein